MPLEPDLPETPREEPTTPRAEAEQQDVYFPETMPERRAEPEAEPGLEEPFRPAAEATRGEERRGRRRRGRRRPSGGPERERPALAGQSPERGLPRDGAEPEDLGSEDAEPSTAPATTPPTPERSEEGVRSRGKRRRRRRGSSSRREPPAGGEAEVRSRRDETIGPPTPDRPGREEPEPATLEDDDSVDDDLLDEEQPAEDAPRGEKSLHRAIPSWFDAVNVVISANLESRAKNPDRKSGNRPRGGHERRGRERPGDRPN